MLLVGTLGTPAAATAQRDAFFDALLPLYHAAAGTYGDEGKPLQAHLETLATALNRWTLGLEAAEREWQPRQRGGDTQTRLQAHVVLASLYAERSRFADALREIDAAIRIDAARAPLHRFRALLHRRAGNQAAAADAFRAAWQAAPSDPQNAYHLVVHRSAGTTDADVAQALATLATVERELVRGARAGTAMPFLTLNSIDDDVGDSLAFAPAGYARAVSLIMDGQFEPGMAALRSAVTLDPLVADPAARNDAFLRGVAALRQGAVADAIEQLALATTEVPSSSEAQRLLATACSIAGDMPRAVGHLRHAVRLHPQDERAWLALARTLDSIGLLEEALEALREAVRLLPDSGALRWVLSVTSAKRHLTDETDRALITDVQRLVLLAGKGDLYGRVAALAQRHLDYDAAVTLLEQRVQATPNNAAAHDALGRAYVDQGRDEEGFAELVIALLIDPARVDTLAALAGVHLTADRHAEAAETAARALTFAPEHAQAVHVLGDALARAGRLDEARPHIAASAALQASAVEQQRRLRTIGMLAAQAEIRLREGQYDLASDLWQQVIELQGPAPADLLRLAAALAGAKQYGRAAEALERAVARDAGAEAYRRLAEVYSALGRSDDAARARQSYVERRLQQLRDEAGVARAPRP